MLISVTCSSSKKHQQTHTNSYCLHWHPLVCWCLTLQHTPRQSDWRRASVQEGADYLLVSFIPGNLGPSEEEEDGAHLRRNAPLTVEEQLAGCIFSWRRIH